MKLDDLREPNRKSDCTFEIAEPFRKKITNILQNKNVIHRKESQYKIKKFVKNKKTKPNLTQEAL